MITLDEFGTTLSTLSKLELMSSVFQDMQNKIQPMQGKLFNTIYSCVSFITWMY